MSAPNGFRDFTWRRRAHSSQSTDGSQSKDFGEIDAHLLEQTVEKLVRYGQQVGVTPEQ